MTKKEQIEKLMRKGLSVQEIARRVGSTEASVRVFMWKIRNPERVAESQREANRRHKIGLLPTNRAGIQAWWSERGF